MQLERSAAGVVGEVPNFRVLLKNWLATNQPDPQTIAWLERFPLTIWCVAPDGTMQPDPQTHGYVSPETEDSSMADEEPEVEDNSMEDEEPEVEDNSMEDEEPEIGSVLWMNSDSEPEVGSVLSSIEAEQPEVEDSSIEAEQPEVGSVPNPAVETPRGKKTGDTNHHLPPPRSSFPTFRALISQIWGPQGLTPSPKHQQTQLF